MGSRLLRAFGLAAACWLCRGQDQAQDVCDQPDLLVTMDAVIVNVTLTFAPSSSSDAFIMTAASQGLDVDALARSMLNDVCLAGWISDGSCLPLAADFTTLPAASGLISMSPFDACSSIQLMENDQNYLLRLQASYTLGLSGMGLLPLVAISGEGASQESRTINSTGPDTGPALSVTIAELPTTADGPHGDLLGYQAALWALLAVVCLSVILVVIMFRRGCLLVSAQSSKSRAAEEDSAQRWLAGSVHSPTGTSQSLSEKDTINFPDLLQGVAEPYTASDPQGLQFCLAGDSLMMLPSELPDAPSLRAMSEAHGSDVGFLPTVAESHNEDVEAQQPQQPQQPHGSVIARAMATSTSFMPHGFLGNYFGRGHSNQPHGNPIRAGQAQLANETAGHSSSAEQNNGVTNIMKVISRLKVDFDTLRFQQEIGRGSSKNVFLGRWGSTSVAIVRMKKGGMVTEAKIMQKLGTHPNLVQFYRWARDHHGNEYMVMELVRNGSLDKLLGNKERALDVQDNLKICEQICCAMCELSQEGLLHCDLAARNVLVASTEPIHVKVADFGMSREWDIDDDVDEDAKKRKMLDCIPLRWTPPEVLSDCQWSEKSDVWAFGVTMWEIFSGGEEPYVRDLGDVSNREIMDYVMDKKHLSQPAGCPDVVYQLMENCWSFSPEARPTFETLKGRFVAISGSLRERNVFPKNLNFAQHGADPAVSRPFNSHGASSSALNKASRLPEDYTHSVPHGFVGEHPFSAAPHGSLISTMTNPHAMDFRAPLAQEAEIQVLAPVASPSPHVPDAKPELSEGRAPPTARYESISSLMPSGSGTTPAASTPLTGQQAIDPYVSIHSAVHPSSSGDGIITNPSVERR